MTRRSAAVVSEAVFVTCQDGYRLAGHLWLRPEATRGDHRSQRTEVLLRPRDLGFARIGHFGLFHDRHREGFWRASLRWLHDGVNPWPEAVGAC